MFRIIPFMINIILKGGEDRDRAVDAGGKGRAYVIT
jgi:hypothetical protein